MTTMTVKEVREEQVTDLTVKNAYRVSLIREKGKENTSPVPFHFRKVHKGMHHYVHLYGNPEDNRELHPSDFKNWDAVGF